MPVSGSQFWPAAAPPAAPFDSAVSVGATVVVGSHAIVVVVAGTVVVEALDVLVVG